MLHQKTCLVRSGTKTCPLFKRVVFNLGGRWPFFSGSRKVADLTIPNRKLGTDHYKVGNHWFIHSDVRAGNLTNTSFVITDDTDPQINFALLCMTYANAPYLLSSYHNERHVDEKLTFSSEKILTLCYFVSILYFVLSGVFSTKDCTLSAVAAWTYRRYTASLFRDIVSARIPPFSYPVYSTWGRGSKSFPSWFQTWWRRRQSAVGTWKRRSISWISCVQDILQFGLH